MGHHVMPTGPGTKFPGTWRADHWEAMPGWAKFCDTMPAEFIHEKWERWPDAGVCVAHGSIIGLDVDTDRDDVARAVADSVPPANVRRRGQKGWMGYYRPGDGLENLTARVRWFDPKATGPDGEPGKSPVLELLLYGTQSVLPPTIHPATGQPYIWLTEDTLEDTPRDDLPVFDGDALAALDAAMTRIGLTRQAPRRVSMAEYDRPAPGAHDLEKPFGRSLNDRAMQPASIDRWWPALDMPKSRQRGVGAWEAVPWWRTSGSGRAPHDRNPNLKAVPSGIVDFGADRSYTPVDVVMAARDCGFDAAADWLQGFVDSEDGATDFAELTARGVSADTPTAVTDTASVDSAETRPHETPVPRKPDMSRWAATPVFSGTRSRHAIKPVAEPSDAEWELLMPEVIPAFPIQDFSVCEGLLGEVARHIDDASPTSTEAGALAVSLPMLGAAFGRAYASDTNLRTNIYTVAIGGSGSGKTSLVNPAKELMQLSGFTDWLGQDSIKSGSGLIQMLRRNHSQISMLDEFGHMLQQMSSPGAGIHSREIITEFTKLYSSANTIFTGTAYASRDPEPIDCPHLCIFGMATPDQFWRAFGSSALEDGSVARYLVFPLGQTGPKEPDVSEAQAVADAMREVQTVMSGRVTGNMGNVGLTVAHMDEYAATGRQSLKEKETAFAAYAERMDIRGGPAILRRVTENAVKVALISAVGRNPSNPEIDGRDMEIGHALAWWSANVMIRSIASHIADNQLERDVNDVERRIEKAGPAGLSKSDLKRSLRGLRARDLTEITDALEETGQVVRCSVTGATKPTAKYVHRKWMQTP